MLLVCQYQHRLVKYSQYSTGLFALVLLPYVSVFFLRLGPRALVCPVQALIPALCMNVYIVGLNQIFDIEIDKVRQSPGV